MNTRRDFVRGLSGLGAIIATGQAPATIVRSMMGARSAITAPKIGGGGGGWVNPYATNGLIHFWDGEWNVAGGEHDASATTWSDIVGGLKLTLNGSASFGDNYMETTDYASGAISDTATQAAYFEIVYTCAGCQLGWYSLIDELDSNWIWCEPTWVNGGAMGLSVLYWKKSFTLVGGIANSIIRLGISYDGSVARANNSNMTKDDGYPGDGGLGAFSIFGNVDNIGEDGCCRGRCYSCRLYSSIPTEAERAANYAVDVARFGLQTA